MGDAFGHCDPEKETAALNPSWLHCTTICILMYIEDAVIYIYI